MSDSILDRTLVARDLTDLGLANLGSRVLESRLSIASALDYVEHKLQTKERARDHTSDPDRRQESFKWCEKAKFLLDHWEDRT